MNWYYAKNGSQHGPITADALKAKIASGEVAPSDLAWREGLADWSPVSTIAELTGGGAPVAAPAGTGDIGSSSPAAAPSPYSPPTAPPAGGYQPPAAGALIPNYLWQSIVVTLLCCLPLGIPAIVFASKVDGLKAVGDFAGAKAASDNAKRWTLIALICGVVFIILYAVLMGVAGVSASRSQM